MKILALIFAACICVAVAGCGSSDSSPGPSAAARAKAAEASELEPGPKIEVPKGPPPKKLIVRDLKKGRGPVAGAGDEVTIEDVGVHWDGSIYSNSWTFPEPPSLVIGARGTARGLMYGLDRGIRGMRVGGRREVLVPRHLIYYPDVKHHAPTRRGDGLVFLVDLLAIR